MNSNKVTLKHIAFLRGINVGGHHKAPMADLKKVLEQLGFENITTLLNSGNVIFDAKNSNIESLEELVSKHLEKTFGFPIPTIIRNAKTIQQLYKGTPFKDITIHKDIRLYVSFLKKDTQTKLDLPWKSADNAFRIIAKSDKTILSILDLSFSKTPKAMNNLEKLYGKNITTRNWKTIARIANKL
ncbi:MAG: DUF1697 domain-containing protein [Flavobacteriaceae bacterium]